MTRRPHTTGRKVDWVGLVAFASVIAVCVLMDFRTGLRAFGAWMILTAVVQLWTGRLPVGWDGPLPSPRLMAAMALILSVAGAVLVAWPDVGLELIKWIG